MTAFLTFQARRDIALGRGVWRVDDTYIVVTSQGEVATYERPADLSEESEATLLDWLHAELEAIDPGLRLTSRRAQRKPHLSSSGRATLERLGLRVS